ncbi:hypothetical protein FH972_010413 [Carpinus fangiana]|uniref:Uncharacterized protein n=1 Tax=Carpinus fangiana TaxID=176857 RepID=A0A660KR07_9ROSI|nr:hypothetical protein FH972_010413 [Carpinus fangiana]
MDLMVSPKSPISHPTLSLFQFLPTPPTHIRPPPPSTSAGHTIQWPRSWPPRSKISADHPKTGRPNTALTWHLRYDRL